MQPKSALSAGTVPEKHYASLAQRSIFHKSVNAIDVHRNIAMTAHSLHQMKDAVDHLRQQNMALPRPMRVKKKTALFSCLHIQPSVGEMRLRVFLYLTPLNENDGRKENYRPNLEYLNLEPNVRLSPL